MELRKQIKAAGLYQWQVCKAAGISEPTLIRWLRCPTAEQASRITAAIETLKREKV